MRETKSGGKRVPVKKTVQQKGKGMVYAVILAGGSGTRFWPLSRENTPKQLLRIFGDTTMIQQTVSRVRDIISAENIFIVTGSKYAYEIRKQAAEACRSEQFITLIEPSARNTAAAVGFAAAHIMKRTPEAVMAVMPSDHVVLKKEVFARILVDAAKLAEKGYLTTFGIVPSRPETGYGYIRKSSPVAGTEGFRVERFVEKPDLKTALEYVRSGEYFWNSGIFVWRVKDLLEEMKRQMPDLFKGIIEISRAIGNKDEEKVTKEVFSQFGSVSIDYGIMEKARKVAVIPADMGWSDVGSWRALDDIAEKDGAGNVITGNVIDINSKDTIVYAGKRLIATVGLEDMVVVDTPDATLICSKKRTQDVRRVVDELKKKGSEELLEHLTVERPWGSYTLLEVGSRYKIKRIMVKPGAKLSRQLHHHRSEHWVVVSGTALVTVGEKTYPVHPNESTYVPISTMHRLENPGKLPLKLIEVQNGDYIEEDDIVRFDDEYGRASVKVTTQTPVVRSARKAKKNS